MSDTESFIEEVTEEVRRDRLFALLRRYGWIAIALVVILVAGAALNEYLAARERAQAQALGDALSAALAQPDPAARVEALAAVEAQGRAAAIRGFLLAEAALEAGDRARAADALRAIAADASLPAHYRDLGALKLAMVEAGEVPPVERIATLEPIAGAGAPYRLLALEQIALAELEDGRREEALARLRGLAEDSQAQQGLRQRVSELIVVLGGEPSDG